MEIVTVSIIIGGTVLFFIGTQIVGVCCRKSSRRVIKRFRRTQGIGRRRRFHGTSEVVYGSI